MFNYFRNQKQLIMTAFFMVDFFVRLNITQNQIILIEHFQRFN